MPSILSAARAPRQTTARSVLAWLCILLILITGSIHLFHQHSAGDDAACGLCAVAHLSVMAVPIADQPVVAHTFSSFIAETTQAPPPRFLHPNLYVRPPPALTDPA